MPHHTPGPWKVVSDSFPGCYHAVSENGSFSTGCISFDGNGHANARLIAAAPEMYDALVSCAVRLPPSNDARLAAVALLARIDGEQGERESVTGTRDDLRDYGPSWRRGLGLSGDGK